MPTETGEKRTRIRKQMGGNSQKTLRLLRYGDTIKAEDGWAKLSTLRDRGLMLTVERLHGLSKGKGGGRKIRFETAKEENTEEAKMRLIIREERKKRKYTPLASRRGRMNYVQTESSKVERLIRKNDKAQRKNKKI